MLFGGLSFFSKKTGESQNISKGSVVAFLSVNNSTPGIFVTGERGAVIRQALIIFKIAQKKRGPYLQYLSDPTSKVPRTTQLRWNDMQQEKLHHQDDSTSNINERFSLSDSVEKYRQPPAIFEREESRKDVDVNKQTERALPEFYSGDEEADNDCWPMLSPCSQGSDFSQEVESEW